ncbi:MAG: nicotinate-nucleotide--dimethylbenzimidazole phosphoribosyltransferase [Candidatus Latescibacterota bacterium]
MGLLEETTAQIAPQDPQWRARAQARLEQLTMPRWALGRLMHLAVDLAGMTRSLQPPVTRRTIVTMAADHGVAAQGVSQYPSEVTRQMVANFAAEGAAINALAGLAGARLVVVDLGVAGDLAGLVASGRVLDRRVAPGTADISQGPAMSRQQARQAVETGIGLAQDLGAQTDVFGTGDMGIGNTTPSAAIAACLTGLPAARVTGRGTGIDAERLAHKVAVVTRALAVNAPDPDDGLGVLSRVGGFEIGGIAGLILGAASQRKPVVVDGFISTAGALVARALAPACEEYTVLSHASAEAGHAAVCAHLGRRPLLDLEMRLGEGTGAALCMPLLEAAVRILTRVRTFAEAGVSTAAG